MALQQLPLLLQLSIHLSNLIFFVLFSLNIAFLYIQRLLLLTTATNGQANPRKHITTATIHRGELARNPQNEDKSDASTTLNALHITNT